jgi:hypothetical protein
VRPEPLTGPEFPREGLVQRGKRFEHIAVSGYEAALAAVDVHERTELVPLDLKNPVWMRKRLADAAERHGLELRKGH